MIHEARHYCRCPECGSDQHQTGNCFELRTIAVAVTHFGKVLWFACPDCGARWHRWHHGLPGRKEAEINA